MGEERLRRKRRSRGEDRREGQLEAAVEWWVVDGECKLVREIVTSIGTRRDFDEGEPAAAAIRLCGVGDCVIVIVVLSLPPFLISCNPFITLFNITFTPLTHTSKKVVSGKAAISAVSGHSNARQKQVVVSEGETRNESGPSLKGQRSHRLAHPASLSRLSSLSLACPPVSLTQTLLSHHSLSLYALLLSRPEPACQSVSVLVCRQPTVLFDFIIADPVRTAALSTVRTSSLQARLLPPRRIAPAFQSACLPRTHKTEKRHDSIPAASFLSCQAPTLSSALIKHLAPPINSPSHHLASTSPHLGSTLTPFDLAAPATVSLHSVTLRQHQQRQRQSNTLRLRTTYSLSHVLAERTNAPPLPT